MNRELLQQALWALKDLIAAYPETACIETRISAQKVIATLEAAIDKSEAELAKPEQEPVRWFQQFGDAPPRKEWVGLTDEDTANICMQGDINNWHDEQVIDATEAKLKEKNS